MKRKKNISVIDLLLLVSTNNPQKIIEFYLVMEKELNRNKLLRKTK